MDIDISKLTVEEIIELKAKLAAIKVGTPRPSTRPEDHPAFNWDWSKPNRELSSEHGTEYWRVAYYRRILGKTKATKFYPECKEWDWSKPDSEIAREHKCGITSVRFWRNSLGKPNVDPVNRVEKSKSNKELKHALWESLDWQKPDVFLCRKIGVTRERIRQIRALLGKPRITKNAFKKQQFLKAINGLKQISDLELKEKCPFLVISTARKWCRENGIAVITNRSGKIKKYPWDKLDFGLPNILLGEIWKIPVQAIGSHRYAFQIGKPLFNIRGGEPPQEFSKVISDERLKAADYYASKQVAV